MTALFPHKSSVSFPLVAYLIIALLGATVFSREHANAQGTLEVKFSYEAKNYAPMEYLARAQTPITRGSGLRVSAMLWQEAPAGNVLLKSPQDYVYRWYLNNHFAGGGKGINAIDLAVPPAAIAPQEILLNIEDLRGKKILTASQKIPLAAPTVVIFERIGETYSYVSKTAFAVPPGGQITLTARPFFFSVIPDSLSFKWTHAERRIDNLGQNPAALTVSIAANSPSGQQDRFGVEIANTQNTFELSRRAFTIHTQ